MVTQQKEITLQQTIESVAKIKAEKEEALAKFAEAKSDLETAEEMWKASAEEEALKVHARVRDVIEKKEETIFKLLRYCDQATEKCQHLEALLERQTMHNYLGPKSVKLTNKLGRKYSLNLEQWT